MGDDLDLGGLLDGLFGDNSGAPAGDYGLTDYLSALGFGSNGDSGVAASAAESPGLSSLWGGEAHRADTSQNGGSGWNLGTLLDKSGSRSTSDWGSNVSGWLSQLAKGDRETTGQAKLGIGALGMLSSLLQKKRSRGQLTPQQLQAMLASKYNNWTPQQQQSFNNYFYQPLPQFQYQPPPIQPPRGYAKGGDVGCGCLNRLAHGGQPQSFVSQGAGTGGQGDAVPARLSPGEYVMDADVVSALGDGDNASGAARLDEMRERIRAHKRSAPPDSIPPKAKAPLNYLKGAHRGA